MPDMQRENPNIIPAYLPRDRTTRARALDVHEEINQLHDIVNKMADEMERMHELQRKSATRHNLLGNSGFSDGLVGWTQAGAGGTFSVQTNRTRGSTSNKAARLAAGAGNAITLSRTIEVFPGQRFSMSGWVKITTGSGSIQFTSDGTNPDLGKIEFSDTEKSVGSWIPFPSPGLCAPLLDTVLDATTVTITLTADASSTIDFAELQAGHGTQRMPHLWVGRTEDKVYSGVWTPTGTGVANITTVTPGEGQWLRVGSTVNFSFPCTIDPAVGATPTQVRFSLPVASTFGAVGDCSGTGFAAVIATGGDVQANVANSQIILSFISDAVSAQNLWQIHGSYQVI